MKNPVLVVISTVIGLAACMTVGLPSISAGAKVRVVPYAKIGHWNVRAVYSSKGPFDHCSANARYQSGTNVSIIVYRRGNWRLWFAHKAWPDRGRAQFPAILKVDGRTVLNRTGNYKGRNAYVDLGYNIQRVRALMRGRSMAISSPTGTSRFSLTGTNRATQALARCWKTHSQQPAGGAFGSSNNSATGGAFGSQGSSSAKKNELPRANTLELATRYLGKGKQSYSILPPERAPLKHFPVNWKLQDGSIGGMRIFTNTNVAVGRLLDTLLSDQAKNCKGRNASQREPERQIKGRRLVKASGVCETAKGKIVNLTYKIAEIGRRMVMVVMEIRSGTRSAGPGLSKTSPPGSKNSDDEIRLPGPNEL